MSRAQRDREPFGVLSIDLNDFKPVNDCYGHAAGDHLLKIVAERLRNATRASDFCARVGGDEFAIICSNIRDASDLQDITLKLKEALSRPFQPNDVLVDTSASIGWALSPNDGENLEQLMACADARMYQDKQLGKAAKSG